MKPNARALAHETNERRRPGSVCEATSIGAAIRGGVDQSPQRVGGLDLFQLLLEGLQLGNHEFQVGRNMRRGLLTTLHSTTLIENWTAGSALMKGGSSTVLVLLRYRFYEVQHGEAGVGSFDPGEGSDQKERLNLFGRGFVGFHF